MLFGLVLWSGFMPLGSLPPDLASRIRWPFSSSSAAPSWWRQRDGGGSGESPLNKLAVALGDAAVVLLPFPLCRHGGGQGSGGESQQVSLQQCLSSSDLCLWRGWSPSLLSRRFSGFSFLCMFLQQMRSGGVDADGDDARHQRWSWRGYGAHGGQPVLSSNPLHPMAEGRPFSFLPAKLPQGRQYNFSADSMAYNRGGVVGPSGFVPSAGDLCSARGLLRTRLHFTFVFWGPPCISQGSGCNLYFSLGPAARCSVPPLKY